MVGVKSKACANQKDTDRRQDPAEAGALRLHDVHGKANAPDEESGRTGGNGNK